jgi:hypothetical protein
MMARNPHILIAAAALALTRTLSAQTLPVPTTNSAPRSSTAPRPSTDPATMASIPAGSMTAIVDAVVGNVQVRPSKDAPWQRAVVGMQLAEGTDIRTGFKSSIRCVIPPDQTFTLDRLGTVELTQAIKDGNVIKTDLTMKYGRTQYRIEHAGLIHDAAITSPSATLAVRGTTVELEDSPPFRPHATSYTGRAAFNANDRKSYVGSPDGNTASLDAGAASAADTALLASVIDPQSKSSRTPADSAFIANQVSLGATVSFDRNAGITVIKNGPGPIKTEADLVKQLPGVLDFVARWTGNANVNLAVGVSYGDPGTHSLATGAFNFSEYIYPGYGLNVSPSGGRTDYDNQGGPNGGMEVVYWPHTPPVASYAVSVILISGEATDVTINAFYNGQKLPMFANEVQGSGPTFTPTLPSQTVSLGGGNTLTFLSGKSTTFSVALAPDPINYSGAVTVYLPLDPSQPIAQKPDLNNGAPADLPGPTPSPNSKLAQTSTHANRKVDPGVLKLPTTPSPTSQSKH